MPITLGSNVASLTAQRKLAEGTASLSKTFERLSSGQRINRASDDAAGLAIADSLNARSRIFNQGVRNLNDGQSLLSIADSAIEILGGIVIRLEELAEQSANGVYTNKQRKALDAEAQALAKEFFRISKTTEFNGQRLLTGEFDAVNLQGGVGANAVLSVGVGGAIGTGSFGADTSYATADGAFTQAVSLGDLNGDGFLDLITGSDSGSTQVRLGTGSGSFGAAVSYADNSSIRSLSTGDLNGDGILDLVTGGTNGGGRATVRLGVGNGTFGAATSYTTPSSGTGLSLGDLNSDGILDLVIAGGDDPVVRLGRGDGSFGAEVSYTTNNGDEFLVALGDLNGDDVLDLVTAGYDSGGVTYVRMGKGNGTFSADTSYSGGTDNSGTFCGLSLGDLNGDGILDLVTAGYDSGVRLGRGDGTFGGQVGYSLFGRTSLGDLNGDGILDLVTADTGGTARVRLGTGSGTFGAEASYVESINCFALSLGDLNGDGVLDLVTAGYDAGLDGYATTRLSLTKDGVAPLLPFSLKTLADARQALPVFGRKREQLATQRGDIGAFQSRTAVAVNVLQVSSENFRAAEARIRDADIADESSRLVRLNILQQAASLVLAQANQQPALALRLLGA